MLGPPAGRVALASRTSLSTSILRVVENRRTADRLAVAGSRTLPGQQGLDVVDLSTTGLAIRVWGKAAFARGERYSISLRVGQARIEIEGQVCWTRSDWDHGLSAGRRGAFFQTAGFALSDGLDRETAHLWRVIGEAVQRESTRPEIGLVSLPNGSTTARTGAPSHSSVTDNN